jgi:hypothetical protein
MKVITPAEELDARNWPAFATLRTVSPNVFTASKAIWPATTLPTAPDYSKNYSFSDFSTTENAPSHITTSSSSSSAKLSSGDSGVFFAQ